MGAQLGAGAGVAAPLRCSRGWPSHQACPCLPLTLPPTEQHSEEEYGAEVGPDGRHRGGPFTIQVSPRMRVEELRNVIRVGGWVG